MLNKVEARNSQGSLMTFEFDDVSDGLVLKNVQGLDPPKAVVVSSTFAKLKGKQLHAARTEERNIIIKLGLQPDYVNNSVQDLRDRLYDFFMPTDTVNLRLYRSEGLVVEINGIVETCDAPLFTDEPAMDISILCMQPDFVTLSPTVFSGNSVSDSTEATITYTGNATAGLVFTLNVNRTLTQFTFYFRPPDGTLRQMDFAASLVSGDVVTISTVPGNKYAKRTRSGVDTSLLYAIPAQANWHQLSKGDNKVRIYTTGAAIPYTISYYTRYGGL